MHVKYRFRISANVFKNNLDIEPQNELYSPFKFSARVAESKGETFTLGFCDSSRASWDRCFGADF